jgi:hypothetical protein
MDFIITLLMLRSEMNAILTITNKFIKLIKLMPGKDKYTAKK